MHRFLLLSFLLPACAVQDPDGPPPLPCEAESRYFAIDTIELPRDLDGAVSGLDLDLDGEPDNAGGFLLSSLFEIYAAEQAEAAWSTQLHKRLDDSMTWLVEITACGDAGAAHVNLHHGVREGGSVRIPDSVPADGEAAPRPASGVIDDGRVRANDGIGVAPLGALADLIGGADVAWHAGHGVAADVTLEEHALAGTIGFGFGPPYRMVIGETFLGWLNALLDLGVTSWGLRLDRNDDGLITYEELESDSVFDVLLRPDLDLTQDGAKESISFGMAIQATEVTVL